MSLTLWQSRLMRLIAAFSMLLVIAGQVFLPTAAVAAPLPANLHLNDVSDQSLTTQVAIKHAGNFVAPLATNQQLQMTFSLKERDSAAFTQFLSDLYNPSSPNFHKFITPAEYGQRFGPDTQTRQQVTNWLTNQGFQVTFNDQGGSTISFRGSVALAEKVFNVKLNTYSRQDGSTFFANDVTPLIPSALASKSYGVFGLSSEVQMHNDVHVGGVINGGPTAKRGPENTGYTPTEYRNAYNIPAGYTGSGVKIAVFEVGFGSPNSGCYAGSNVDTYDATFGITPPARVDESVDGQLVESNDGNGTQGEAELDIEAINAIAPAAQVYVYCGPYGSSANTGFLDTNQRIATDNLADVASESYGGDEIYYIQAGIPTYLDAENNIFRQMAAQGQSMFTSAGDTGSGSGNRAAPVPLTPQDPASQPYITTVGGTRLYMNGTDADSSYLDETVWNRGVAGGAAGGGISDYWPASAVPWQKGPGVSNPFSQAVNGRQYPDISADADPTTGMAVYSNFGAPGYTNWYYIGGTSLASPLVAGMIGDAVQQNGGHRLGLISPSLYTLLQNSTQYGNDFHDIVKGNNDPYCVAGSGSCDQDDTVYAGIPGPYYPATPGYDDASGVGSPNVGNLVPSLISLNSGSYLLVSDSLIGIGADVNGASVSRPITVTAIGASTLNFTASTSFTATNLLSLNTTSGTVTPGNNSPANSQTLTLSANPGSLAAGDYYGSITITGTMGTTTVSSSTIAVDVKVGTVHTSNGNSDVVLSTNDTGPAPTTQSVVVTTTSTTPQTYILNIADFVGFLTVGVNGATPQVYDALSSAPVISVSASNPVTLTFGASLTASKRISGVALSAGTYSADVQLLSGDFPNSIDQASFAAFHVKLNLAGQLITAAPLSTNFSFNAGGTTPASQVITVSEAPVFTQAASVPVTFTISPSNLITVTPTSGTVPASGVATFTVTPLTTTVAPGVYNSNITFYNGLNPNNTTVANVVETVGPSVSLSPSAYSLVFTTTTSSPAPQTQSITLTANGGAVSYTPAIIYPDQTPWLSINPNGGSTTIPYGSSSRFSVSVNPTGLGPGAYNGYIQIKDNTNPTGDQPIRVAVLLNVVGTGATPTNPGSLIYPLPFLSNGAGGTATFVTLQNIGVDPANVTVNYYNNNGSFITTTTTSLPVNGQSILDNSVVPTTTTVNAVISSTAPLNVLVTEGAGGANGGTSAAAYNVSPSVGSTLYDPVALNGAFGGFTTTVTLYNTGSVTTTGSINYFDQNGNAATGATANFTLAPHQVTTVSQNNPALSASVSYFGVISSTSGSQLAAIVTESNTRANFLATFQATPNLAKTLYVPTAFKSAFGSFNTGFALANPNSTAVTATISYVDDASGTVSGTETLSIPANGEASSYTPAVTGLPSSFVGSAIITSTGAIIATVNEQGAAGSGTYLAVGSPAQTVGLPAVANGAFGSFVSGATLFNVTSAPIQVAVSYYNSDGTVQGPTTIYTVPAKSSVLAYQGGSSLPNGFFGTVVATSDTPNSLVATVNMAAPGIFYTYTEPTR